MPSARQFYALLDQAAEIDLLAVPRRFQADLPRLQYLIDSAQQSIGIRKHKAVKLLALRRVHVAPLQRLEIETDRGNRRLQFMRDRVDKAVVLLVAPDLTHQKDRVQDDSRRNRCEED